MNQNNYGTKSLRSFGPKVWNSLPHHVKTAENLEIFKKTIVAVLFLVWKTFHENLLGVYYSSAFLFIAIFTYIYIIYIYINIWLAVTVIYIEIYCNNCYIWKPKL